MLKSSLVALLLAVGGTAGVKATSPEPERRMDRFTELKRMKEHHIEFSSETVHESLKADSKEHSIKEVYR